MEGGRQIGGRRKRDAAGEQEARESKRLTEREEGWERGGRERREWETRRDGLWDESGRQVGGMIAGGGRGSLGEGSRRGNGDDEQQS